MQILNDLRSYGKTEARRGACDLELLVGRRKGVPISRSHNAFVQFLSNSL